MTKVSEVVRDALLVMRVIDASGAPDADEARDAVNALNRMMRTWEAEGLALGWSDVEGVDDDLPAPAEAEEAIVYGLALRLRPIFGRALEPDVIAMAESSLSALRALSMNGQWSRVSYDDLPVGSGQRVGSWRDGFNS